MPDDIYAKTDAGQLARQPGRLPGRDGEDFRLAARVFALMPEESTA